MAIFGLFGPPNAEKLKAKRNVERLSSHRTGQRALGVTGRSAGGPGCRATGVGTMLSESACTAGPSRAGGAVPLRGRVLPQHHAERRRLPLSCADRS
jgi:hypothetical protein